MENGIEFLFLALVSFGFLFSRILGVSFTVVNNIDGFITFQPPHARFRNFLFPKLRVVNKYFSNLYICS